MHHKKNQNMFLNFCYNNLTTFQVLKHYLNWYSQWLSLLHYLYISMKEMLLMFLLIKINLALMLYFLLKKKSMHIIFLTFHVTSCIQTQQSAGLMSMNRISSSSLIMLESQLSQADKLLIMLKNQLSQVNRLFMMLENQLS